MVETAWAMATEEARVMEREAEETAVVGEVVETVGLRAAVSRVVAACMGVGAATARSGEGRWAVEAAVVVREVGSVQAAAEAEWAAKRVGAGVAEKATG